MTFQTSAPKKHVQTVAALCPQAVFFIEGHFCDEEEEEEEKEEEKEGEKEEEKEEEEGE